MRLTDVVTYELQKHVVDPTRGKGGLYCACGTHIRPHSDDGFTHHVAKRIVRALHQEWELRRREGSREETNEEREEVLT